mmetsp:Transcript_8531/g.17657  ORF Transcript_8531/g.17657 Transcript_8531/m.17657 type:complete len:80 (-) Transcript_8531:46-285(-)
MTAKRSKHPRQAPAIAMQLTTNDLDSTMILSFLRDQNGRSSTRPIDFPAQLKEVRNCYCILPVVGLLFCKFCLASFEKF